MNYKANIGVIALGLFGLISFSACSSNKEKKQVVVKEELVKVMTLKEEIIDKVGDYTATLKAWEEVHLAPSTPGRVEKIHVEVGDIVTQGQVLVTMDQTQLLQTELQLKNIETEFKRADILYKAGSYSAQAYDQLKTQYEVAQENIKYLRKNTQLKAPFSGVISGKYFENGEMYSGTPISSIGKAAILSLVEIDKLKAVIAVPESDYPIVKKGMAAGIASDTYPGKSFTGTVNLIYPIIDPATRSFEVEFKVQNPNSQLRPGMYVRVSLNLGKTKAMVVPDYVVLKMQGTNERYVFLDKKGIAQKVTVQIGARFNDKIEILSKELAVGDKVVKEGQGRLINGSKLKIVE